MQIAGQIGQIESFVNNPDAATTNTEAPSQATNTTPLTQEEVKKIVDDAAIE